MTLPWHRLKTGSCTPRGEPRLDSTIQQMMRKTKTKTKTIPVWFWNEISFFFGEVLWREGERTMASFSY